MAWRWIQRRRLTIGLVVFFTVWYLLQRVVLRVYGARTARWWFYITGDLTPGYLLAPLSHHLVQIGHLQRNVGILLLVGAVAEPYLRGREYLALVAGLSGLSLWLANMISVVIGTLPVLAGPSGGIYGMWAYIGVRKRAVVLGADGLRDIVESGVLISGVFAIAIVPLYDMYAADELNIAHTAGILIGYGLALIESQAMDIH